MNLKIGNTEITLIKGDITQQNTDAIVNAANSSLLGGGGVDGAIHKAGGSKILEECKNIRKTYFPNGLPTGEAVITSGGKLKAKYVIHTVGPVWYGGKKNEPDLLRNCYFNSLKLAVKNNIKTVSFPAISTGAYGYPIEKATIIVVSTLKDFLLTQQHSFSEIRFILFSDYDYNVYKKVFMNLLEDK